MPKRLSGSIKSSKRKTTISKSGVEYEWVLREYEPGKWIPTKITVEEADILRSLETMQYLEEFDSPITYETVQHTAQNQIYVTLRMSATLNNFKETVLQNWYDYGDSGSEITGDYFYHLMEKIENNPITHEAFTQWVRTHRYLYEYVFYQTTVYDLTGEEWEALTESEQEDYLSVYQGGVTYQENFEKVVHALEDILDSYGVEY